MKKIIALLACLLSSQTVAANLYNMQSVVLLQPEFVLNGRVNSADMADYVLSINSAAESSLRNIAKPLPTAGFIVVAVRPGRQAKAWLDLTPALPSELSKSIVSSVENITPFDAKAGLVVFAINVTFWNATPTTQTMPMPSEWSAVIKSSDDLIGVEEFVDRVWR